MKQKVFMALFFLLTGPCSWGNLNNLWPLLKKKRKRPSHYARIASKLVRNNLFYTAIPSIKEYLIRSQGERTRQMDRVIDRVARKVGVRQFEVLPAHVLSRSRAPMVRYIVAKKYFRKRNYSKALTALRGSIPRQHSVRPFALFLKASILSLRQDYSLAISTYQECVQETKSRMKKINHKGRLKQLAINRDYCLVGIARSQFAEKKYSRANLSYLDLSKESFIWPEILFEEAWTSFYEKDYNRALGKLVTYKAPILENFFNPEVDILRALSYMELCLWRDARKVVNNFYQNYERDSSFLESFLRNHGKDYRRYYLLAKAYARKGRGTGNRLINKLLKTTIKDPAYSEMRNSFYQGQREIRILKRMRRKNMRHLLRRDLKEALVLQRDLIGAYIRRVFQDENAKLRNAFKGMSYIKLEALGRQKTQLYSRAYARGGKRGDIKYLKRNEKQYFWTFKGEFWADSFGDYVFSLKSECS